MTDESTQEQEQAPAEQAPEHKANDQALPSMATWTPPWEGNINKPRPVVRYERELAKQSSE